MGDLGDSLRRALPCAVLHLDAEGRIRSASERVCEWLGCGAQRLEGRLLTSILRAVDAKTGDRIELPSLRGEPGAWEGEAARGTGTAVTDDPDFEAECTLELDPAPAIPVRARIALGREGKEGVCALTDLRPQKSLEFELRQSQQLESVGRIAAGIAHEINTPVQFIGDSVSFLGEAFAEVVELLDGFEALRAESRAGFAPVLLEKLARAVEDADLEFLRSEVPASLERTLDGVARVAEIARAIKEFSYPDPREKEAVDLNTALRNTLTIARNEYKYVADIETDLGSLPPVFCHPGYLNQVFLNLIINAAHAIEERQGAGGEKGVIRVVTRSEGETVLVTIADTGCGIPEGIRERVFDAFFTTKEVGRGSGQGLALARSVVVEKHGGTLSFDSRVGEGTRFSIRLPVDGRTRPHRDRA